MKVPQMVILFHSVRRFILSFWIRSVINFLLIFLVDLRCEEGLNCVFLSGVL